MGVDTSDVSKILNLVVADAHGQGLTVREHSVRRDPAWSQSPNPDVNDIIVAYGGHEFSVSKNSSPGSLTAEIAARIQEDIIDDNARGWPMSRSGSRLLEARAMDGQTAWWYDGDEPIVQIGAGQGRP